MLEKGENDQEHIWGGKRERKRASHKFFLAQ